MVGTIVSLLGTAASGIGSAIANKKYKEEIDLQHERNQNDLVRQLTQDPTQRSDNAAYLRALNERLKAADNVARSKGKIMGETPEVALAQQQNNANAYADAISSMQAMTDRRRDKILAQKLREQQGYQALERDRQKSLMQNWSNLADNAAKLGGASIEGMGIGSPTANQTKSAGAGAAQSSFDPLKQNDLNLE